MKTLLAIAGAALLTLPALSFQTTGYDLVIANGRVIDPESKLDAVRHVGISGGKIAVVSEKPLNGKTVIDAKGLIVAPGFIDLHSHAVATLPGSRMQIYDGVTTQLELENGLLPVAKFYEHTAKEGRPANYGASASWTFARAAAINGLEPDGTLQFFMRMQTQREWSFNVATPAQQQEIVRRLEDGLKEGGLGIGIAAAYAPGFQAREMIDVHHLAARFGVPTFQHIRYMGVGRTESAYDALLELIATSKVTGAHIHICHFHSVTLQDIEACMRLVEDARKHNVKITVEAYSYGAGCTVVNATFLRTDDFPQRYGFSPADIVYLATGERINTFDRLREIQKKDPGGLIVNHFYNLDKPEQRAKLDRVLLHPDVAIASDSLTWQVGDKVVEGDVWPLPDKAVSHPRSAGCYCKFLREYVRERKAVSWMEALRRCSLLPAQILEESVPQMKNKGRLRTGADADIVVLDPEKVADRATFERPNQTSVGMVYVLVNGTPVIRGGELDRKAMAGRAIRREGK